MESSVSLFNVYFVAKDDLVRVGSPDVMDEVDKSEEGVAVLDGR